MLQFSKIAWRGSQKLVLQSCFLGLSRSGGGVRISIVEPNPAPCPVWSACPDRAATFRQVKRRWESREGCGNQLPGLEAGPRDTVLVQGSPTGSESGKKTQPHCISLAQETQGHAWRITYHFCQPWAPTCVNSKAGQNFQHWRRARGGGFKPNPGGQVGKVQGLRPAATWAYAAAPPSGPARALSLESPCTCSS